MKRKLNNKCENETQTKTMTMTLHARSKGL